MSKKQKIIKNVILVVVLLVVLWLGNLYLDTYLKRILNLCAIYTIMGLSMNLVNGFTGLFSLGQAGFMAIGAYCVAIFTVPIPMREAVYYMTPMNPAIAKIQLPFIVALILGGIVAAAIGACIGAPVLRLRGDYLAIATLGFSEIIRIVFTNWQSVTNGALGIKSIPTIESMWWTFGVATIVIVVMAMLIHSSYGRALKAIREDEIAAEAMGISLFKHKMIAFVTSAFMAGIGGGLFAALLGTVDPKQFYFTLTYNFLLIIVLGGMGSISGTVIGAFIVTMGLEWLRFLDEPLSLFGVNMIVFRPGLRMVVFSLLLMIVVLFYRKGIMGQEEITFKWLKKKWESITLYVKKKRGDAA
ncbi:MAG: branched-chain amino acid ABC transporter permease [Cellulosilyticaceae bacterium]